MYHLHDIYDAAVDLAAKLNAPTGAIGISSFIRSDGDAIIVVHVRPQFKHLTSRIPAKWMGFDVEWDVSEMPSMNEQNAGEGSRVADCYHIH
jgi:hypothetical protein